MTRKIKEKKKTNKCSKNSIKEFATSRAPKDEALLLNAKKYFVGFDKGVFVTVIALSLFGILMVYSASYYTTTSISDNPYYYLIRQIFWVLTGFVGLTVLANLDYHMYYKYSKILIIVSIIALLLVLAFGISVNGAQRWLGYKNIRITPSEFSKLIVIIWTSVVLAQNPEKIKGKGVIPIFCVMAAHAILIVKQPNLSTAIVICAIMFAIMFVAGLHPGWICAALGALAAGVLLILKFMQETHWYSRLTNFIDPFADSQGEGYQVAQSVIALGNGGITGLGFSKGISKNLYLPEPQNDFILAVIGEELGFIGFLILIMVYFVLLFRLIVIALKSKDRLGFYIATGISAMLGIQLIINVAVVTSSAPATGITLPFISYGGTSTWVFLWAIGIAINIGKQSNNKFKGR